MESSLRVIPRQNKEDLNSTSVSLLLLCDAGIHVDYDHAVEIEGKAHSGTVTLAVIILRKFSQRHSKLLTKMLTEGSNDNSKGTNKQIVTQNELQFPEGHMPISSAQSCGACLIQKNGLCVCSYRMRSTCRRVACDPM